MKSVQDFILKRITGNKNDAIIFLYQLKNHKLKTGFEVIVRKPNIMNRLKEEKQTIGLFVGKEASPTEIPSYPLTSLPLTLTEPSGSYSKVKKPHLKTT